MKCQIHIESFNSKRATTMKFDVVYLNLNVRYAWNLLTYQFVSCFILLKQSTFYLVENVIGCLIQNKVVIYKEKKKTKVSIHPVACMPVMLYMLKLGQAVHQLVINWSEQTYKKSTFEFVIHPLIYKLKIMNRDLRARAFRI